MRGFHFIPLVLAVATARLAPAAFVPQLERFAEKSPVQASDSPRINVYSSTSDDFKKLASNPDELMTKMTALNKKIAEEDKVSAVMDGGFNLFLLLKKLTGEPRRD